MDIHITRKGEKHGPYPEATARQFLEEGKLSPTDLAWHAGADGWKPLSEVLGATSQPPAAAPQPKPPGGGIPKRTLAGAAPAEAKPAEEKTEGSEGDDPDKIRVTRKGEPIGPYSRDKAKEYFAAGQLLPTDWGWHDGMDEWKPLYEVLGMEVPTQTTAASGKPGKGKKVAMIAGVVVLVSGLVFAGITYGPDLMAKISGGGKIETPEELAKRAVKAFAKKDFETYEKLTSLSFTEEGAAKLVDALVAEISEEDLGKIEKMSKKMGKPVEKSEIKEKIKKDMLEDFKEVEKKRDKFKEDFEELLSDGEEDGVVWSEVEFVSVDTSDIEAARGLGSSKSAKAKSGDLEVTISHKGKSYVVKLDNCKFHPVTGWWITRDPQWRGEK